MILFYAILLKFNRSETFLLPEIILQIFYFCYIKAHLKHKKFNLKDLIIYTYDYKIIIDFTW